MIQNFIIQARTLAAVLLLSHRPSTALDDRLVADGGPPRDRHRGARAPGHRHISDDSGTHRTPVEARYAPRPRLGRSTPPRHRATGDARDSNLTALLRSGTATGRRRAR